MGYAVLGAFLVATFLFSYPRPQRGVLLFAGLVPFHGLLPILPLGLVPAFWKEALLGILVIAAALSPNRIAGRTPAMPWLRFAALLILVGTVSGVAFHGWWGLLPAKVSFLYAALIPPIVLLHPFTSKDRDRLVTIIMSVSFVSAVYGIAQQFLGGDTLASWGYLWNDQIRTAGPLLRSFSFFQLPFPFGLYEMMALLVGGAVAMADPRRLRNKLFLWSTPIILVGMVVSIVRASYLGVIIGVIFLSVVAFPRIRVWIGVGASSCVAALVLLPASVTENLLSSDSLGARSAGWSQMLTDLTNRPVGQGLGLTGAAADKLAEQVGASSVPYQPDNYYVKLGLELGPVGIILFVVVLVLAYMSMMRAYRLAPTSSDRYFAVGVAAFILATAAASMVATFLEIFPLDIYFWLLLSVGGLTVTHERTSMARSLSLIRFRGESGPPDGV